MYVDWRFQHSFPKIANIRVLYYIVWVFVVFTHLQNNRYFRSLYKRAVPHDLRLIGAFDQKGFAPVGHYIQQVAFDHYRRTSLVHRPYTR